MAKKNVCICINRQMKEHLNYAMEKVEDMVVKEAFNDLKLLESKISFIKGDSILIIDSYFDEKSTIAFTRWLKEKYPKLRIILLISPEVSRLEVVELIKDAVVSGAVVTPFTAKQIEDYIKRL